MSLILSDQLQKNHCAPVVSKSGFVTGTLLFVTLALPMFLVTQTHNFWQDTMTYFEQPSVKHQNELMVFLYTDTKVYAFASTKNLNDLVATSNNDASSLAPSF